MKNEKFSFVTVNFCVFYIFMRKDLGVFYLRLLYYEYDEFDEHNYAKKRQYI